MNERYWFSRIEAFYVDGVKVGAIVRYRPPGRMKTLVAFRPADGEIVVNEQETWFESDVLKWTKFRFSSRSEGSDVEVDRDPEVHHDCVPAYAELLLVERLVESGEKSLAFGIVHESKPGGPVHHAKLTVTDAEEPVGDSQQSEDPRTIIELTVDGVVSNRHTVQGGVVIGSDWRGARSYLAPDLDAACSGLPADVRQALVEFRR